MRRPLLYIHAAISAWKLMYAIEKREGRRLTLTERRAIGTRTFLEKRAK